MPYPSPRPLAILLLLALVAPACGPSGEGDGDAAPGPDASSEVTDLVIEPGLAALVVVDGVPDEQTFVATATFADGSWRDVSAEAVWTVVEPAFGAFTGATFAADGSRAGETTLRADYGGASASVLLTVDVVSHRVLGPAPGGAPGLFAAATEDPGLAPTVVYPPDGTLMPPNLGGFEVHFSDAAGADLFEVSVTAAHLDLRVYVVGTPLAGTWTSLLPAEWDIVADSYRGGEIGIQVRALSQASPGTAGTAPEVTVGLAREDLVGGIYYWAAASAQGLPEGIYRHDFGQAGLPAEEYYTVSQAPDGRCVACHALSRAGDRMSITFDGGDGAASILDVASRQPILPVDGTLRWNFAAFHPDGERVLTTFQGVTTLRDPETGAEVTTVPTDGYSTMPDWSPGGDAMVYVSVGTPGGDWHFGGGRLVTQTFDPATDSFGAAVELVPAGTLNIYYPAWSPDGQWIAFNQSDGDSYDDATAQLWVIRADGTAPPLLLGAADVGVGLTNSWVRWAPFEQTYDRGEASEPLLWLTFSSKRDFGVRLVGALEPQVWMTAFFPSRAAAAQDPTLPAFRLPFQEIDSNNHIAQWTEVVVPVD